MAGSSDLTVPCGKGVTQPVRDPSTDGVVRQSLNRRKRPSGFAHGGARKGVAYELERAMTMLRETREYRTSVPLSVLAILFGVDRTNLYFRVRRHKIPYIIGPKPFGRGEEMRLPRSSLPLLEAIIWKLPRSHT